MTQAKPSNLAPLREFPARSRTVKTAELFLFSAGSLLLVTAVAKFISSAGRQAVLMSEDPIFHLSFRELFTIVGLIEVSVALLCLFSRRILIRAGALAWLSTCFGAYRLGLLWLGYHIPCGCLGTLTDALQISPKMADLGLKSILGYFLVGSYGTLFLFWKQRQPAEQSMSGIVQISN